MNLAMEQYNPLRGIISFGGTPEIAEKLDALIQKLNEI